MKMYRLNKRSLEYSKFSIVPYMLSAIILILLLSISKKDPVIPHEKQIMTIEVFSGKKEFSFALFKEFVIDSGIKFPDIVIAQAVIESGFKSTIWQENNNPFGMKVARSRNTTAIGVNRNHAKYKNWQMAVIDYAYFQAVYARKIKSREDYYKFLEIYAEDQNYTIKIKNVIHKHKGFNINNDYLDDL